MADSSPVNLNNIIAAVVVIAFGGMAGGGVSFLNAGEDHDTEIAQLEQKLTSLETRIDMLMYIESRKWGGLHHLTP